MTKLEHADDIRKPGLQIPMSTPRERIEPCWNRAETLARIEGDEELLRELCQIFRDNSPKLLLKLREAIATGDWDGVHRAAHSLKGASSYLSAKAASNAALQLENMGRNRDLSHAAEMLAVLEREVANLLENLETPGSGNE